VFMQIFYICTRKVIQRGIILRQHANIFCTTSIYTEKISFKSR